MARGGWRGVNWAPISGRKCTRHGEQVTPSGVCLACHQEQLAAAANGSREFEIQLVRDVKKREHAAANAALSP